MTRALTVVAVVISLGALVAVTPLIVAFPRMWWCAMQNPFGHPGPHGEC